VVDEAAERVSAETSIMMRKITSGEMGPRKGQREEVRGEKCV